MIRAILFDLDGTLFDRDGAVRALVENQHRQFGRQLAHIPATTYVDRVLALDAHGHGDKTAAYQRIAAEFDLPAILATELTRQFWTAYPLFSRPFPEVIGTLTELRARGLKLGVVTNGTIAVQEKMIQTLGLEPVMDAVLISERERVRKPAPAIFHRALVSLNVAAAQAWFVGDHPTVDIEGARAAGLRAIWRRNGSWAPPHVTDGIVDALDELLALVSPAA